MDKLQDEIFDILMMEKSVILSGDYDRLNGIIEIRESLIAGLKDGQHTIGDIASIRTAILRNSTLLESALKGAVSAKRRIAEITAATQNFGGYAIDGTRTATQNISYNLDHRS